MIRVQQQGELHRLLDDDGKVALNTRTGKPLDGGGHADAEKARRQAGYVNAALDRKKGELTD